MELTNAQTGTAVDNALRIAIVGYGGMGRWHGWRIRELDCLELAGIYDIRKEPGDFAREHNIPVYDSFEAILADESVSIVTVAVPNHLHKDLCIRLMEAGKHVVCEKPVALNSTELQEMIDAANRCGVLFTVHQNRRWDEDFRVVKKLLDENTLGNIFRIESRVHGSRGVPGDWRNQKQYGGGMVLDWGVHLFDQILQMGFGKLKSVYSQLSFVTNENCDDGFTVLLSFENGPAVEVQVGTSNFINLPRWYVLGENGSAVIENFKMDGKIVMVSDWDKRDAVPVVTAAGLTKTMAPRTKETIAEYPLPRIESDVHDFYRNVVKVIRGEETQLVTHAEVMRVMKLMEAVFESSETNKVIDFE